MNKEDCERFARYRKGYIAPLENEETNNINNINNIEKKKKSQIGFIDNIEVKVDNLVKTIIDSKNITKI